MADTDRKRVWRDDDENTSGGRWNNSVPHEDSRVYSLKMKTPS